MIDCPSCEGEGGHESEIFMSSDVVDPLEQPTVDYNAIFPDRRNDEEY